MVKFFRQILSFVFLLNISYTCYGLNEKPTIAVFVTYSDFDKSNKMTNTKIPVLIGEALEQGLMETNRYQVVERELFKVIRKEKEEQKTEDYLFSKELAEQGISIGSDFILLADVGALTVNQATSYQLTTISISLNYRLELLDVRKRQSLESMPFRTTASGKLMSSSYTFGSSKNKDIYSNFQERIGTDCKQLLFNALPLEGVSIIEVSETNKKGTEAQRVLINAGESDGLYSQWLNRFQLQVIEDFEEEFEGVKYKRDKIISDLSVASIVGDHLAVCKVKNNEKELFDKIRNKSKLYIRYKKKSLENALN